MSTPASPSGPSAHYQPLGPLSVSLAVLTMVLWGGTAVSNQFAMDVLPPVFVGGIRFGLAALFMIGWCWFERSPLLLQGWDQWRTAWWLGILLFAQIGTFNIGVYWSTASHASILVNSYIFWVAAFEHFFQKTIRLRWWQFLGLLLAGSGCLTLLLSTADASETASTGLDQPTLWGDFVLALSGFMLGVKILFTKHAVRNVKPGPMILWHDVFGTMLFFAVSGVFEDHSGNSMNLSALIALLYGGVVVSGMCFAINALLLRHHGASQVSVFSFGTPLCGVLLGVSLRGDELTLWLLLAGVLVAVGILLVNLTRAPEPE
jgi:drug/metabolite transporter (DMT)-like permease